MTEFPIFISYSRRDIDQIRRIRDEVESATGARCWMDLRAIESGVKRFTRDIVDGINNCEVLLFMLTENSQHSEFALRELDFADKKGKHVVIINVNDCAMTDEFQFLYGLTDTISWTDVPQREKLLRDLKRWIAEPEPQPDPEQERLDRERVERERAERERQESERKAREASERERLAREAAERERQERERKAREESQRKAKEEAERVAREKVERERMAREQQDVTVNPKPNKKSLPWIIGGVVAVAVVGLVLFFLGKGDVQASVQTSSSGDLELVVDGISYVMKPVEGGTFQMGSNDSEADSDEKPVHSITVSSFYMGETEVTQALWKAVMGGNPSRFKGDDLPVEQVSWNNCQEFIEKLNGLTGKDFRLPTEAEWEYAARGGKKSNGYKYAGSNTVDNVAWYDGNSGSKTHPVKTKQPNELGLYDMSGNVFEWCQDRYGSYSSGSQTDPKGPSSGSLRLLRGGSWGNFAGDCRVSFRGYSGPGGRGYPGFRLVLPQCNSHERP